MPAPAPEYLLALSRSSLQDFMLNRLNHAANLRKHAAELFDEWIRAEAEVRYVQWLIEQADGRAAEFQQRSFEFDFHALPPAMAKSLPKRKAG